jgi:peptidoglycan hydrolase-like protein with peptidoglycan-binding domain
MSWLLAFALAVVLSPGVSFGGDETAALGPDQIRMVQRALHDRGYGVEPTGAWDASTRAALSEFQSASKLPATGTLDGATARALGLALPAKPPSGRMARGAGVDPAVNCEINNTVDCLPGP